MSRTVYVLKNISIEDSSSGGAFPTMLSALKKISVESSWEVSVYGIAFDDEFKVAHQRGLIKRIT